MRKIFGFSVLAASVAVLLVSCGGGGGTTSGSSQGGGSVSALTVAEKISVVDAQTVGGASPSRLRSVRAAVVLPPTSDYNTDKANVYVEERSVQSFNTVNEILCMIGQTRYDVMLNRGPYKAQVDANLCKGRGDASAAGQQSANQSSGSDMPKYEMWTVDSSRADNTAPQVVKVWVHESAEEYEPEKVIFAKATVVEGVSPSNPVGIFNINFQAFPAVNGVPNLSDSIFKGILKSERVGGDVLLKFFDVGSRGTDSSTEKVVLNRTQGGGTLFNQETSPGGTRTKTFDIAFNDINFHRVEPGGGTDVCLSRSQFAESAWRYGVYDATGARVARNSGFPVRFSQGGQEYHGYIGYWGPWFPGNVTLVTGDNVYKQTYGGGGAEVRYEVLVSGGKLKKHTRNLLALGDIAGIPLEYMEGTGSPNDNQYRVLWTGTAFTKVARMNRSDWTWQNLTPAVDLDLGTLKFSELNFWSQALSGNVQVKLQGCAHNDNGTPFDPNDDTFSCIADDATPVVSYAEVVIDPSDTVPPTLACFENCPDVNNLGGPNPFFPFMGYQPVPPSGSAYTSFTFDATNMTLKSGATAVVASSLDNAFQWGLMSGPLFDPSAENLDLLRCPWDNNTCAWQARSNLPEYYTWETGPNTWNRLVSLKEPVLETVVRFDPPLLLQYTHTGNGYTNAKFYLEYAGFGDLHGIPGKCVDMDTGADADCSTGGPGSPIRWVPEFTIPDGSAAISGSATYYMKSLEKEQRMMQDPSGCASLPVVSYASQLPGLGDWSDPGIGSEPSVSGPPAVIGGVPQ